MTAGPPDNLYADVELRLRHLAEPLGKPRPGDWLAHYREEGQTFRQYLAADPVRHDDSLTTLYLCLVGEIDAHQSRLQEATNDFLALFFDAPVRIRRHIPLSDVPAGARRRHPEWGDKQLLSGFLLRDVLEPDVPNDALAYLAVTTRDLWPGRGWNFVYGEASLRRRVGVWSIYRSGYPGKGEEAFRLSLLRTLKVAAHETGHVLTLAHCTAFRCLMNGFNGAEERDRLPLHPCPVCLRKVLWNLQVEPAAYLARLEAYCRRYGLDEAQWYARAAGAFAA